MPFFETKVRPTYTIDYSTCQSIDVIVSFAPTGEMRPTHFRLTTPDDTILTFKIETIKCISDFRGGLCYLCLITDNELSKEVKLMYYINEHLWVLKQ